MKGLMLAGAVALASAVAPTFAFGQTNPTTSNANAGSNSVSGSTATNIFNSPAQTRNRSTVDTTANAFAPGLTSAGLNSCAGSASLGGAGTGFSFGAGATFEMEECTRRANAAALAGIGQVAAAREILCDSPAMASALARTGYICIQQRAEYQEAIRRAQETGQMVAVLPAPPEPLPMVDLPTGAVRPAEHRSGRTQPKRPSRHGAPASTTDRREPASPR